MYPLQRRTWHEGKRARCSVQRDAGHCSSAAVRHIEELIRRIDAQPCTSRNGFPMRSGGGGLGLGNDGRF